jgi:YD repeat-containing protein
LLSLQTLTDTRSVNGNAFTTTYTAATRVLSTTSAIGRTASLTFDTHGSIVQRLLAPNTDPITYAYDAQGRLVQEQQGNEHLAYSYDNQNRVISETDATGRTIQYTYDQGDRVTSSTSSGGHKTSLGYDANGNLMQLVTPANNTSTFGYSSVDQPASASLPGVASMH